jgi:hypothetical protein
MKLLKFSLLVYTPNPLLNSDPACATRFHLSSFVFLGFVQLSSAGVAG